MTVMEPLEMLPVGNQMSGADTGCRGCCGTCGDSGVEPEPALPGFDVAIAMAEAASNHNPSRWSEIRSHADDPAVGEYCSSLLLGALLRSSAHRLGVPTADIWAHIRRTGELPL